MKTLISMRSFIFHLRNMTTTELCKTYPKNFKTPVWNGNQSDMVKNMLAIDAIQWKLAGEYAKFFSQKLEIWMFVPCKLENGVWVVLAEPRKEKENELWHTTAQDGETQSLLIQFEEEQREFKEAKERCLFEGFEYVKQLNDIEGNKAYRFIYSGELTNIEFNKTIEALIYKNLTLTQNAINQIFK